MTLGRPNHIELDRIKDIHSDNDEEEALPKAIQDLLEYITAEDISETDAPTRSNKRFKGHTTSQEILERFEIAEEALQIGNQSSTDILGQLFSTIKETNDFYKSEEWLSFKAAFCERFPDAEKYAYNTIEEQGRLSDVLWFRLQIMALKPLLPFILKELKKPKYKEITTMHGLFTGERIRYQERADGTHIPVSEGFFCEEIDHAPNETYKAPWILILDAAKKAAAEESLPSISPIIAKTAYLLTLKPARALMAGTQRTKRKTKELGTLKNKQPCQLNLIPKMEEDGKVAMTVTDVKLPTGTPVTLGGYLNALHLGVGSFYETKQANGEPCWFTTSELWRLIYTGDAQSDKKPKQNQVEEMEDGLRSLGTLWIKMDVSNIVDVYSGLTVQEYEANCINIKAVKGRNAKNGKITQYWYVPEMPPFFALAKATNQYISISTKWLETKLRLTKDRIALRDYLIFRIHSRLNNKILWSTLFESAIVSTAKNSQTRHKNFVREWLDECKKKHLIAKYTEQSDGITVITIKTAIKEYLSRKIRKEQAEKISLANLWKATNAPIEENDISKNTEVIHKTLKDLKTSGIISSYTKDITGIKIRYPKQIEV